MPAWIKPVLVAVISVAVAGVKNKHKIDMFLMRFFRDVARAKAWQRRHGSSKGLISLMREENPITDLIQKEEDDEKNHLLLPSYSIEELLEFGDGEDGRPILIAVLGRVYDVTTGKRFYGEGGRYPHYAGRDITYALSMGCITLRCAETLTDPTQMSKGQMLEAKRWLSFFHLHDKYPNVGRLEDDPLDDILRDELANQSKVNSAKFAGCGYVIRRSKEGEAVDPVGAMIDENLKVTANMEESLGDAPAIQRDPELEDELDAYDGDQEEDEEDEVEQEDEEEEEEEDVVHDSPDNAPNMHMDEKEGAADETESVPPANNEVKDPEAAAAHADMEPETVAA